MMKKMTRILILKNRFPELGIDADAVNGDAPLLLLFAIKYRVL
jgi:hypothetical protein